MIKSMTGFGRSSNVINDYNISVELKSVNHRYFEYSSRIPRQYSFLEDKIKTYINSKVSRGKVECVVSIYSLNNTTSKVSVNESLAKSYFDALTKISEINGINSNISPTQIASFQDVIVTSPAEVDEEQLWIDVQSVLDNALQEFVSMREVEGEKLKKDVLHRADKIIDYVSYIENRSPETIKEYNDKLIERVKELIGDSTLDEARIIQEVAIYADKVAVAEETVRLRSHIDQLKEFLESNDPVGRKIDFLVQEINREANTTGSKCNDVDIARKVVDIKAEVEKIREQIQNIE